MSQNKAMIAKNPQPIDINQRGMDDFCCLFIVLEGMG